MTQEKLIGYKISVGHDQGLETDERGRIIHDGLGQPKTIELTMIVLTSPEGDHQVVVPFDENGKQSLISQLTRGIIIAANGEAP